MLNAWLLPAAIVQPGAAAHGPASEVTVVRPVGVGSVTTTFWASDGPSLLTVIVYVRLSPRCADAGPDFVTRTSARGAIAALAIAVLFAGLKSGAVAGAAIAAVSAIVPSGTFAGSAPVTMNVAPPPAGSDTVAFRGPVPLDCPQVADPLIGAHVHVMPVSAGVVPESLTRAPVTALGPLLRTTTWYLTWAPGVAGAVRKLPLMLRSAADTWVVTVLVWFEPCCV